MAEAVWAQSLLCLFLLLSHHTIFCSGALVGFSYDAREQSNASWSPTEALSFLVRNRLPISQFKLLLGDPESFLDSLPNRGIPASLCLREIEAKQPLNSRASATSWLRTYLRNPEARPNISSIIVSSSKEHLPFLHPALQHVQGSLKTLDLDGTVKVSAMFSLSALEDLDPTQHKAIQRIMHFLRNSKSFAVVEAYADEEVRSLDAILLWTVRSGLSAYAALPYLDIPIVLQMRVHVSYIGAEIYDFSERVEQLITAHPLLRQRISGLFFDISQHEETQLKDLHREEDLMFTSSSKELLNHGRELTSSVKATIRDTMDPITYPSVAPITVPATNPGPSIVTVPSTNPVSVVPTNPTMTPVTIPYTDPTSPVTTPITVPVTNPLPTPMPVTNPATTPTTIPTSPPATNPPTIYPSVPSWSTPSVAPPVTVPSTYPVTPAVTGQTWCVAKSGVPDAALQSALDYACGIGGVDCSAIQPTGSCSYPDTFQAHASYAFNSYYQRNPVATSCNFGGTAMLVNVNPSTATCIFSSSSSVPNYNPVSSYNPASSTNPASSNNPASSYNPASNYNPATSSPGSAIGSGSSVSNTNNPGGSSTVFGSSNPTGYSSNSFSLLADWTFSLCVLTIAYVSITI